MNRRAQNPEKMRIVFLGDGAPWIWDRVPDLENNQSVWILDFYHATEHLSEICKELYGEQTEQYWQQFTGWRESFLEGKVQKVIAELKQMRGKCKGKKRHFLQGQISYFEDNKERMHYHQYIAMKLPFKEFALPYLMKLFKGTGVAVRFFHNDSPCMVSAPYLADCQINLLNLGMQNTLQEIRERTGARVTLMGNVPSVEVMAEGTSEQVKESVRDTLASLESTNGVILSCAGGMPPGVPTENIRAFLEAAQEG
jgi:hypothetical protein